MLLFTTGAYAHVAGSFGDFLLGVKDESTIDKLKDELEETKQQIEQLSPKVEQMEVEYKTNAEIGVKKLQFYQSIGLDTYMKFMLEADDLIDILANQRMIEMKVEHDLQDLNQLYLSYMTMKRAKDSLEGHAQVLQMIENHLEARDAFFQAEQHRNHVELANLVLHHWNQYAAFLDDLLAQDSSLLNENIADFVTKKTEQSPYRLEERRFNQRSQLTYYFRSDHTYVHYKQKEVDVILIGTFSKKDPLTAELEFEAGFVNGIFLSNNILAQLSEFQIDYSRLHEHPAESFYLEQMNGAIVLQPTENAME